MKVLRLTSFVAPEKAYAALVQKGQKTIINQETIKKFEVYLNKNGNFDKQRNIPSAQLFRKINKV